MKRIACSGESVMDRDDSSKYDVDSERYDAITSYPILKMESRRIFYSKFFDIMKYYNRY
jgi:hypothetical protein